MTNLDVDAAENEERAAARQRVQAKREFVTHLVVFGIVNTFLTAVWALSGAGYFWPVWSLGGWGIAVAMHAWTVFGDRPVTEVDVDAEVGRSRARARSRSPETE